MSRQGAAIGVLVVDDDAMVCRHLRTILDSAPDIEVRGEAYDGAAALEAVLQHRPELVLMDLRMPGVDGLTAIERISRMQSPPVVVALTTFDRDEYVMRSLRSGAVGFLLKSTPPEDLVDLVRVAADGHTVMSPSATRRLLASAEDRRGARDSEQELIADLTEREHQVLGCLGEGMSNTRIARQLHLSEATVKGYVSRLLVKLDCDNRTQMGLLAARCGITGTDPRR